MTPDKKLANQLGVVLESRSQELYWPVLVPGTQSGGRPRRLFLIRRDDGRTTVPSEFEILCKKLKKLAIEQDPLYVYALTEQTMRLYKPAVNLLGIPFRRDIKVIGTGTLDGETITFAGYAPKGRRAAFDRFTEIATRAGLNLSASIHDRTGFSKLSNPAVQWLAAMWFACKPDEGMRSETVTKPTNKLGWTWSNPFADAIQAADRLGLIDLMKDDPPKLVLSKEGEWSKPFSKSEIAKRLLGKKKGTARARDLEQFGSMLKLEQAPGMTNRWIVRLDILPPNHRRTLE